MEQRHADYVSYYEARVRKYEGNSLYACAYAAEKSMHEAISGCARLEDFRALLEKDGLDVQCAIALVKDQETARLAQFRKMEEPVRALSPARILEQIDQARTAMDAVAMVSKIDQEVNVLVSVDLFTSGFYSDFTALDNLAIDEAIKSEVPQEWRQEIADSIEEQIAEHTRLFRDSTLPNNQSYEPGWKYDYSLVWETRHRRAIPFPDAVVERRIEEHKRLVGIA